MKKIERIKIYFKRFKLLIYLCLIICVGVVSIIFCPLLDLWNICESGDMLLHNPTLIVGLIAFGAFVLQGQSLKHQKEAGIKQEIIGAWQVLANKAAGNSGKIEAIEFLAKQRKPLRGIDMSKDTHGGQVYLDGLNVSKKELLRRADLNGAHFEGAELSGTRFEGAELSGTHFEGAELWYANFEGTNLWDANFEGAKLWGAIFKDSYIFSNDKERLPSTLESDKFKFDFIYNDDKEIKSAPGLNKKGKPTGRTKYFIQLIEKEPKNEMD